MGSVQIISALWPAVREGFLALDGEWQEVDTIRILMDDEESKRIIRALEEELQTIKGRLDESIEREKTKNHFLTGIPAFVGAIKSGKIECRVYRKDKFHAPADTAGGDRRPAVPGLPERSVRIGPNNRFAGGL